MEQVKDPRTRFRSATDRMASDRLPLSTIAYIEALFSLGAKYDDVIDDERNTVCLSQKAKGKKRNPNQVEFSAAAAAWAPSRSHTKSFFLCWEVFQLGIVFEKKTRKRSESLDNFVLCAC